MKASRGLILLVLFVAMACSESRPDYKTAFFEGYLAEKWQRSIPQNMHVYVLIPRFGCIGCMEQTLAEMAEMDEIADTSRFSFIASNMQVVPPELAEKVRLYEDSTGDLDKINIRMGNVTLVETQQGKVQAIKSISAEEVGEVERLLAR